MATQHATSFPIKNQAYRVFVHFRNATGVLVTGWTGAASEVSIDFAAAAAGPVPVEIGTTGLGYIDIPAATMNATAVLLKCTVTNVGANAFVTAIMPLQTETAGRADDDTEVRFEKVLWNIWSYWMNRCTVNVNGQTIQVMMGDDVTEAFAGAGQFTAQTNIKGKLS